MGSPSRTWRPRVRREQIVHDLHRRGWAQHELARHAGISAMTVSRVLRGVPVTITSLAAIAHALERPLDDYLYARADRLDQA